jgi:enoyl-CoA hydratase/carnithine racemase
MTGQVRSELMDGVLVVTLDNQAALNAWTIQMQRDVVATMDRAAGDDAVTAVVFTGAGDRAFCAGQHLAETSRMTGSDVDGWLAGLRAAYAAVLGSDKPTVAAINGVAAGSGYQLALLFDLRVAHATARIGQPEVNSGIPSITGAYLTRQMTGHGVTADLMLSGRLLSGTEAHAAGLVQQLVEPDQVVATAIERAADLAAKPGVAFRLTKRSLRATLEPGLWAAFDAAAEIDREAWDTGQPQAVMDRFLDRSQTG